MERTSNLAPLVLRYSSESSETSSSYGSCGRGHKHKQPADSFGNFGHDDKKRCTTRAQWTAAEEAKIMELRERYGTGTTAFKKYVPEMPGRTEDAIRQHYYGMRKIVQQTGGDELLSSQASTPVSSRSDSPLGMARSFTEPSPIAQPPRASRGKTSWSLEEDQILLRGFEELGNKWRKIAEERLPGRTENMVRQRHNRLTDPAKKAAPARTPPKPSLAPVEVHPPPAVPLPLPPLAKDDVMMNLDELEAELFAKEDSNAPHEPQREDSAQLAAMLPSEDSLKRMTDEAEADSASVMARLPSEEEDSVGKLLKMLPSEDSIKRWIAGEDDEDDEEEEEDKMVMRSADFLTAADAVSEDEEEEKEEEDAEQRQPKHASAILGTFAAMSINTFAQGRARLLRR